MFFLFYMLIVIRLCSLSSCRVKRCQKSIPQKLAGNHLSQMTEVEGTSGRYDYISVMLQKDAKRRMVLSYGYVANC